MKKTTAAKRLAAEMRAKRGGGKEYAFASWSFTRYNDYRLCPLKARLKHLGIEGVNDGKKIEEPGSDAMARGSAIGVLAQIYITGKLLDLGDKEERKKFDELIGYYHSDERFAKKVMKGIAGGLLPDELERFKKTFAEMRALHRKAPQRMVVEKTWAMRKDWSPTVFDDWNGCAVRVKIDCGNMTAPTRMIIRDWKTGKYRAEKLEEYVEQLELYALTAFQLNDQLEGVEAFLFFLDHGIVYPEPDGEDAKRLTFVRTDVPRLKKLWDKRTRAMLLDRAFAARPNRLCQWCHYRKANAAAMPGGKALCKY